MEGVLADVGGESDDHTEEEETEEENEERDDTDDDDAIQTPSLHPFGHLMPIDWSLPFASQYPSLSCVTSHEQWSIKVENLSVVVFGVFGFGS